MAENENKGGSDSTQYIKSNNMSRTDDNRLRSTKREDPMNVSPADLPDDTDRLSNEGKASTEEEGPSCAI